VAGPANLDIGTSLWATSSYEWALSLDETNGDNKVVWQFATSTDGNWNLFATSTPNYYDLANNVAQGNTHDVYFRIIMPTDSALMNEKYFSTVTIVATAP
jgi:hypothetical protein